MKLGTRQLKLGFVVVGYLYFTYVVYENPNLWALLILFSILSAAVVFDRGRAKAIDEAYESIHHMKGFSEECDLILYHLAKDNPKTAQIKLIRLKLTYPEHGDNIAIASLALDKYFSRPWWKLW
jgi:hypothetical protein